MSHTIMNIDMPIDFGTTPGRSNACTLQPASTDETHNYYWSLAPLRLLVSIPRDVRLKEGQNYIALIGSTGPKDRRLLPNWHSDRFFTRLTILKHIANPLNYEQETGRQYPRDTFANVISKSWYNSPGEIILREGDRLEITRTDGTPCVDGLVRLNHGTAYLDVPVSNGAEKFGMQVHPAATVPRLQ